jgi:hypothetical protein
MPERKKSSIRLILLVLMLVVGPVQAQTLFACEMMDQVLHDSCCCDENSGVDDVTVAKSDPCCEKRVELTIDHSGDQSPSVVKPVEVRSDVDPPQLIFAATHSTLTIQTTGRVIYPASADIFSESGSRTYLITQRLRI